MRAWRLLAVVGLILAGGEAGAQATSYVQIEAQPTRAEAEERARAYGGAFADVNGFRLSSGWWAIALGPYARPFAAGRLAELRRERLIPADSFLVEARSYGARYWPPEGGVPAAAEPPPGAGAADPGAASAGAAAPAPAGAMLAEARQAEAALGRAEREAVQAALVWAGFYGGAIDGAFGAGTRAAMAAWQADRGHEPTGVLTAGERESLVAGHAAEVAALGLEGVRDEPSGIALTLPLALVEFAGYAPPFVRYEPRGGSGLRIRLVSREGGRPELEALFAALTTAPAMAAAGPQSLAATGFTIEGGAGDGGGLAHVESRGGLIKGYVVEWDGRAAARMPRIRAALGSSFAPFGSHALDAGHGTPLAVDRAALLAGVEPEAPLRARSGVFVDAAGAVLTTAEAVAGCGRILLDGAHPAAVAHLDEVRGLAVLRPRAALSPRAVATLAALPADLPAAVAVAGYPWGEALPRPVLTFGRIAAAPGPEGAGGRAWLELAALAGDTGGPVLDAGGGVVGLLVAAGGEGGGEADGRLLPAGAAAALDAGALAPVLAAAGVPARDALPAEALAGEDLARLADGMTVLVTCWR